MAFTKPNIVFVFLLVISFKGYMADPEEAQAASATSGSSTYDASDAYQQYYEQYVAAQEQPQAHQLPYPAHHGLPKQDEFTDINSFLASETGGVVVLGGLLLGGIAATWAMVDQAEKQNSICTTTKALGNTVITYTDQTISSTDATMATQLGTLETAFISAYTALNNLATPKC